jgi:hypothetical protein
MLLFGSSHVAYGMCEVPSLVLEREMMNEQTGGFSSESHQLKAQSVLVTSGF